MEKIEKFLGKYSVYFMLLFLILTYFNTCGTKTAIKVNSKDIKSLKESMEYRDSLNTEIYLLEREISNLEIAREVVYTNNAIVRQVTRPDDVMNQYDIKIKNLRKKLDTLKNGKK